MSLRRRNSISTTVLLPSHLTLPHPLSSSFTPTTSYAAASSSATTSSSSSDFDTLPVKPIPSYTSLKDLISGGAAAANSPTAATPAGSEISIRNRLVKQAAWAYLQPMSTSPNSNSDNILCWVTAKVLDSRAFSVLRSAFDWAIRCFRLCFQ